MSRIQRKVEQQKLLNLTPSVSPGRRGTRFSETSCLPSKSISASAAGKTLRSLEGKQGKLPGILSIPLCQHPQQFFCVTSARCPQHTYLTTGSIQKTRKSGEERLVSSDHHGAFAGRGLWKKVLKPLVIMQISSLRWESACDSEAVGCGERSGF